MANKYDIVIIIPFHNEEKIIGKTAKILYDCFSRHRQNKNWIILLTDSASTDKSALEAETAKEQNPEKIKLLKVTEPGRGLALRQSVKNFPSQLYAYIDTDLPVSPERIDEILEIIEKGKADVIVGNRLGPRPPLRVFITFCHRFLSYFLLGMKLKHPQCGAKFWNNRAAEVIEKCKENGYFLDTEFLARSQSLGLKVSEEKIHWIENRYKERSSSVKLAASSIESFAVLIKLSAELHPFRLIATSALGLIILLAVIKFYA